ncbi:CRISPR system precrRNA processing endoribonuclease RAMP protein Cas6 [Limnospira fusiformis KN01]|uniref:CRISPR system precrRNA processing endoribonuclease RAMP protein Cas6 n=1 Tax=Limnospira TaxID=2596745 RepID=UPI001658A92F|nr:MULTISPECIES: CRISPR system precrRNA processing endoribonuclease RAMP protein Cas6 [Limnospira]MDT9196758.1 CRISPR system precrRNA processing endoribonuclease RAMP protein Cas6 [Limnospira sp. PMC 1042.18]ULB47084.1 CRISPR system precrRNA processing endoribonuclease RAMP protein Cas6 [Limnospira fusiformis KN01]
MLIRSTWTLTVCEPMTLPRSYGLELVKQLHHQLGLGIGLNMIPDTSFSSIMGRCLGAGDFITFQPEELYQLTFSGLQEKSSKAIASLDLSGGLEFLGVQFKVTDRQDNITSYEQLYTTLVANEPEPIFESQLKFTTPTSFAQKAIKLPLPVPGLMFRSWLQSWNNFAPIYLGSGELITYLANAIALKRHRISTQLCRIGKDSVNGFVGEITLKALYKTDPLLVNVANLLVQYSEFSGTGIKTRLGMGNTETYSRIN